MTCSPPRVTAGVALLSVVLTATPVLAQGETNASTYPSNRQDPCSTPITTFFRYALRPRNASVLLEPEVSQLLAKAIRNEVTLRGAEVFWQKRHINAESRAEDKHRRMRTSQDVADLRNMWPPRIFLLG